MSILLEYRHRTAHRRRAVLKGLGASLLAPAWVRAAEPAERPAPQIGAPLALPEVGLFDGRVFRPADAEGQVLVLYWWASWCPFCAQQTPHMEQLWLAQRGKGLRMLGLSIDRKAEDATAYLAKRGYTFPAGLVTAAVERTLPKPRGLPVTMVRGRDGRVLAFEPGQLFPEDVEQLARFL